MANFSNWLLESLLHLQLECHRSKPGLGPKLLPKHHELRWSIMVVRASLLCTVSSEAPLLHRLLLTFRCSFLLLSIFNLALLREQPFQSQSWFGASVKL